MTKRRKLILSASFLVLILGSAYDVVTDQEHWPFSNYPMFSGTWRSPRFTWLRLFGVTGDGREFALDANRYIEPFDQSRLPKGLRRMLARPDGAARVVVALHDCLERYDTLRAEGAHGGPAVVALRLYELEWTIDDRAANVDRPDWRQLIAEVRRP